MIGIKFEYYVLNYNFNKQQVDLYNIFNNIRVQEWTEKAVKKYVRSPKNFTYKSHSYGKEPEVIIGFDGFVKELDSIIRCEEWSRSEYELSCGYAFETDCNRLEKWDCYQQAKPNMEMIAREIVYQYKKQKEGERIDVK